MLECNSLSACPVLESRSMRNIKILEHMSLDGVIQTDGGPNEDGDYPYGGWAAPYDDPDLGELIVAEHGKGFDLLLGRHTYDIWSGFWPKAEGLFADSINAATKYVATHRPESLAWSPAEGLGQRLTRPINEAAFMQAYRKDTNYSIFSRRRPDYGC